MAHAATTAIKFNPFEIASIGTTKLYNLCIEGRARKAGMLVHMNNPKTDLGLDLRADAATTEYGNRAELSIENFLRLYLSGQAR